MPDGQGALTGRPRILHLSADYPDLIDPRKTPVISRLIELVEDRYDHRVISLNRRTPSIVQVAEVLTGRASPVRADSIRAIKGGECLEYLAPPKGILHAAMLERLAAWIVRRLIAEDAVPDLVIGHKLTVEGLIARAVATQLGIPYALTIQGNTDQKILSFRRDLAGRFGAVYHEAACVFSFAPWARRAVEQHLGERRGLTVDLPCPTVNDMIRAPVARGSGVISAFHLRNHAIKNLTGLAAAVRSATAAGQPCEVRIFGGGTPEETAQCQAIIGEVPGIHLMGPRTQDELGPIMNGATAFVMPSKRESFGLVFIEALFAGLPIIYPQHASVDGYFDGLSFAIGVDSSSTREISKAIRHVIDREAELKADLAQWQATGGLERFSRSAIARTFADGLDGALAAHNSSVPHRNIRSQSAQDH
ncbi:glycosyltransferase [Porphyrobacter sp. ULC335]|uniref:glycosyltransferase n=1 Tax=Porphyrobacter sp. ULC335 TaxID=2854260 RepID=UPI00221E4CFA|nr:glycosyltransferase [Porphyrobacter sp. ULC335]